MARAKPDWQESKVHSWRYLSGNCTWERVEEDYRLTLPEHTDLAGDPVGWDVLVKETGKLTIKYGTSVVLTGKVSSSSLLLIKQLAKENLLTLLSHRNSEPIL